MKIDLLGDYFEGSFHLAKLEDSKFLITKTSPANITDQLYQCTTSVDHITAVIDSAVLGFKIWKKTSYEDRISYLRKYQELVVVNKEKIAKMISIETGKPYWESMEEVSGVIAKVDVTVKESFFRIQSKEFNDILPSTNGELLFKPLGPSLIIGPFNFPCHLANTQILSALLAGNSIIFKPSEKTVASAQLLIECFHQAGFPKGVINFINGAGDLTSRMIKEKDIKAIYFTGSKEVGVKILSQTYMDVDKLVALEMGGKNTTIIHHDANKFHSISELIKSCYMTSGQRCVATTKVAIHQKVAEEFIALFHETAKRLVIDHPLDFENEPFMGPLIDQRSLDNYLNYMGMAIREGGEEIMRGKRIEKKYSGYYVTPSIHLFKKADSKSVFLNSEIFGPSCSFYIYKEIDEAINFANMGEYGLAASLFSNDRSLFKKCQQDIEVGVFNFNRSTAGASAKLPFGGVKGSGNHRPAAVSMIDSCVYPMSSLEVTATNKTKIEIPIGLI